MQSPQGICCSGLTSTTTRLENSLLRLHQSLEEIQHYEHRSDRLFERWQQKWSDRSEGIFERLELIEAQLDNLVDDDDDDELPPRLGVVGAAHHAEDAHSLNRFCGWDGM